MLMDHISSAFYSDSYRLVYISGDQIVADVLHYLSQVDINLRNYIIYIYIYIYFF